MNDENEMYTKFKNYANIEDLDKMDEIWVRQSKEFREFWQNKLMNEKYPALTDSEIDEIVLILDKNAKGSTKETQAVAKAMIPQGVWRRLFKEIKEDKKLRELLYSILTESEEDKQIELIDSLYKMNDGRKNSLTGKSGNAINDMLFAYNPSKYVAVISLNDRKKIIDFYNFENDIDFENDSQGRKIVKSNKAIIEGFHKRKVVTTPRAISHFLYRSLKGEWKTGESSAVEEVTNTEEANETDSKSSFYMERELENFLIANWDKTELASEYELIEEGGELVSQQYKTDIGIIDILVKDKATGQFVVIELKKAQTSDDTVGQLTRYMGWLEEHKTGGKATKGIIIASSYDTKLYYALKKVKDVEVYTYQVDFKLKEFKRLK